MVNDSLSKVMGIGTIQIKTSDGISISVKDVSVPQFTRNLLSLGAFESKGCSFTSKNDVLKVMKGCRTVLKVKREGNLRGNGYVGEANIVAEKDDTELCHCRLGNISQKGMDTLVKKGYLGK